MTQLRLFTAVLPPEPALVHLDEFLDVRRAAARFRWTDVEQVHLTCSFMAAAPERALDDLVEGLAAAAARRTGFETRVSGGGAFPHVDRAKVLWAGLDLDDGPRTELERLAAGARSAGTRAGIAVDGVRWRPHLTVARMGVGVGVTDWVRLLDAYAGPTWTVTELALVASHLGEGRRRRPRHEVLETFPLG